MDKSIQPRCCGHLWRTSIAHDRIDDGKTRKYVRADNTEFNLSLGISKYGYVGSFTTGTSGGWNCDNVNTWARYLSYTQVVNSFASMS